MSFPSPPSAASHASGAFGANAALMVGCDYAAEHSPMPGSVQAVREAPAFLSRHGIVAQHRLLVDDSPSDPPTKRNFLSGLRWLVRDRRAGDSVFVVVSGRGADGGGFAPSDAALSGPVSQSEAAAALFSALPPGVRLFIVSDCADPSSDLIDLPHKMTAARDPASGQMLLRLPRRAGPLSPAPQDIMMLSSVVEPGAKVHGGGALLSSFMTALSLNPRPSMQQLLADVWHVLRQGESSQLPRLSSSQPFAATDPFVLQRRGGLIVDTPPRSLVGGSPAATPGLAVPRGISPPPPPGRTSHSPQRWTSAPAGPPPPVLQPPYAHSPPPPTSQQQHYSQLQQQLSQPLSPAAGGRRQLPPAARLLQGGWRTSSGAKVSVQGLGMQFVETGDAYALQMHEGGVYLMGSRVLGCPNGDARQVAWDDGDVWTRADVSPAPATGVGEDSMYGVARTDKQTPAVAEPATVTTPAPPEGFRTPAAPEGGTQTALRPYGQSQREDPLGQKHKDSIVAALADRDTHHCRRRTMEKWLCYVLLARQFRRIENIGAALYSSYRTRVQSRHLHKWRLWLVLKRPTTLAYPFRPVKSRREFAAPEVAETLYMAMKGLGTDESAVFDALSTVRSTDDWRRVNAEFRSAHPKFHGGDLLAALRSDLSATELATARSLLSANGVSYDEAT